jgi:hypothetical protein
LAQSGHHIIAFAMIAAKSVTIGGKVLKAYEGD